MAVIYDLSAMTLSMSVDELDVGCLLYTSGHWKDNAVRLKGEAVKSFTVMFLQMWSVCAFRPEYDFDYGPFLDTGDHFHSPALNMDGYSIPFSDSPLDGEPVGHQVYLDILYQARRLSLIHIWKCTNGPGHVLRDKGPAPGHLKRERIYEPCTM